MEFDFEDLKTKFTKKANEIYDDNEKLGELIDEFTKKIKNNEIFQTLGDDMKMTLDMIVDWKNGDYKELSKDSVIIIAIGFLYILSPMSIIPRSLPIKYLDDVIVLTYIMKKIKDELERYKEWKDEKGSLEDDVVETIYIDLN